MPKNKQTGPKQPPRGTQAGGGKRPPARPGGNPENRGNSNASSGGSRRGDGSTKNK